jgi:Na+-translocating ferredoxin:NAD+ oxidoreductase subunit C
MFKKSFGRGGIRPYDYKELTRDKKIENAYMPNLAYIPVIQRSGENAKITVKIGQKVEEGELIAEASGNISANIHSSIPGKIVDITEIYISSGIKSQVIVVELGGEFKKSGKETAIKDWRTLGKKEIHRIIREYGIVGLGGAVFPTHIKLSVPDGKKIETLLINGSECEPYNTSDSRLMLDYSEDILEGISILEYILEPVKIYLGIEVNKKNAIRRLRELAHGKYNVKIVPLKTKYPQGDERHILRAVTGKVLPFGNIPVDLNALVINTGTVVAIKEAVINDKPLIDRVVTITGDGIENPKNLKVKIGTPVKDVIEECGGLKKNVKKVVVGGAMMGFSQMDLNAPVTKECTSIIAVAEENYEKYDDNGVCINCGRCIGGCAYGLMPVVINRYIKYKRFKDAVNSGLVYCKECGACSWVCPAKIPLVQNFRMAKDVSDKLKIV